MLRNLNRTYPRGRVCGTPQSGVLGSSIPAIGTHGAGYAYSSLSFPADNNKEYQGYITSIPAGLTIFANEDTSFTASANDGTYVVPWDLYENGVFLGSTSFSLTFGSGTVISCLVGNAVADGSAASITNIPTSIIISATRGSATANGITANITGIHKPITFLTSIARRKRRRN